MSPAAGMMNVQPVRLRRLSDLVLALLGARSRLFLVSPAVGLVVAVAIDNPFRSSWLCGSGVPRSAAGGTHPMANSVVSEALLSAVAGSAPPTIWVSAADTASRPS